MIQSPHNEADLSKSCNSVNDSPTLCLSFLGELWITQQLPSHDGWQALSNTSTGRCCVTGFWCRGKLIARSTITEQPQQNCTCQDCTSATLHPSIQLHRAFTLLLFLHDLPSLTKICSLSAQCRYILLHLPKFYKHCRYLIFQLLYVCICIDS